MTGSSVRIRLVALGLRDARRDRAKLFAWPRGVTGNTSDSGSEESWFDPRRGFFNLEGWPSGSRRRPAKALGSQGPRGFESHSLRYIVSVIRCTIVVYANTADKVITLDTQHGFVH